MSNISTIGQALDQVERIKNQQSALADLTNQLATGKKTQVFSGLATDVLISQRARSNFKSFDAYIGNITNADRRLQLMSNAISQFKTQAQNFLAALQGFSQQSVHQDGDRITYDDPLTTTVESTQVGMTSDQPDVDFKTLQNLAQNAYNFFVDLVNTQENDRYLFGGSDALAKPLNDAGSLEAAVNVLISKWKSGAITNSGLIDDLRDRSATTNPDAVTDNIVGYSAALSAGNAGRVFVHAGAGTEVDYTTLANDSSFRNIIVAASYIKNGNLPPMADAYVPPNTYPGVPDTQGAPGATLDEMKDNFFEVFNNMVSMVSDSVKQLDQLQFNLDNARARLSELKDAQTSAQNVLANTIDDVENVDTSEVAVRINTIQVQLQASLAVTASTQQLSLVNFLAIR